MSRTQRDFGWPRVVPILERATLPPIVTGPRVFCPKPDPKDLCKQDDYQDYDTRLDSWYVYASLLLNHYFHYLNKSSFQSNPAKFNQRYDDEDEVLMSRKKFMLLNESITCKPIATIANQKMKSTFQVGFGHGL